MEYILILWNIMEFYTNSMECYRIYTSSMEYYGIYTNSMEYYGMYTNLEFSSRKLWNGKLYFRNNVFEYL